MAGAPFRPGSSRFAALSYEDVISNVVKVVEAAGAAIMVVGGLGAFALFARDVAGSGSAGRAYKDLRRNLGNCILLGLEVLIVADIVRTIIVDTTFESVAVLGVIVIIRIVLSFSLEVEINGAWPWRERRADSDARPPS
jgi:uncharacterized membrane protein